MEAKMYIDDRGWIYKVMNSKNRGRIENAYKAHHRGIGEYAERTGWNSVRVLPKRATFDAAQADLDRMAQEKGWREWQE